MSVPSSSIQILQGVPLNNSYEHTLYFEFPDSQENYMSDKVVKVFSNFTYLRPENKIKVAGDVANARVWNYLRFKNSDGKWFYHFIDKVTYLSDSAVELHISLDVIQTYMFDWELKPCFIERNHTATDVFGEHTIPEGLETGPLVTYASQEINLEDNVILVMMACDRVGADAWGLMVGGVYSGLEIYAVQPKDLTKFNQWLSEASGDGYVEAIVSMWMYPKDMVVVNDNWESGTSTYTVLHKVHGIRTKESVKVEDAFHGMTTLDGWTVKNKKTLCYPYTMLYMSNNMGGCATYHRERFNTEGEFTFQLSGALSPDSGVQLTPQNYKSINGNYAWEEALSHPAFPTCAWNSDTYKVWLAQNQNQMDNTIKQAKIQAVAGGVSGIVGIMASAAGGSGGGMLGSFMGGVHSILNAYQQIQALLAVQADMAIQPDQARGNHSGNINLTNGRLGYTAYFMGVTGEYAKTIDQYFTRYGYKVNVIEVPQLRNRLNFTYIKTVGSMVGGDIGTEDQLKIQAIFDKGITFWRTPSLVGDYNCNNYPLGEYE